MNIQKVYLKGQEEASGHNNPDKIILHHPEYYGSIQALNDVMRGMGFYMIGYNYYVRKDGSVWQGRPVSAQSANCYGQNTCSIGVCFEGNYDKDPSMPEAQFNAGVELIQYLKGQYGISEVNGHKHYYNTACPGANFPLQRMLDAVSGHSSAPSPQPSPSGEIHANAKAVNDFFYIRDAQGNKISGRAVDEGDLIEIESINYESQLFYVKYPTPHGAREGYIHNSSNCIQYLYYHEYHNGSTKESVYSDANLNNRIGSIFPHGEATPLFRRNGHLYVAYHTPNGTKGGYVSYNGGFNKF